MGEKRGSYKKPEQQNYIASTLRNKNDIWVYYQNLDKNGYKTLKSNMMKRLSSYSDEREYSSAADELDRMAINEKNKELNWLRDSFGGQIDLSAAWENSVALRNSKTFIETINSLLTFRGNFERNIKKIANKEGQITLATELPLGYLNEAFKNNYTDIIADIQSEVQRTNNLEQSINTVVNNWIHGTSSYLTLGKEEPNAREVGLVNYAIWDAMDMKDKIGQEQEEIKVYKELYNTMIALKNQGDPSLLEEIYRLMHIDDIVETMSKVISTNGITDIKVPQKSRLIKSGTIGNVTGGLNEYFGSLIAQMMAQSNKNPNVKFSAEKIGQLNMKPDIVMTFNVNMDVVNKYLVQYNHNQTSRENSISALGDLYNNYLSQLKKGYIVYTNAKNYQMTKQFGNENNESYGWGFNAGSAIRLDDYLAIMSKTSHNKTALANIFRLAQTPQGAIGDTSAESIKEKTAHMMAVDIAAMLFDDVKVLGEEMQSGKANAIHLLMLDDVYIPLSSLLFALADAIRQSQRDIDRVVKVKFAGLPEKIAYEKGPWGMAKWVEQRKKIFKATVQYHFFASISEWLKQYL